jgi:hypothetical protein
MHYQPKCPTVFRAPESSVMLLILNITTNTEPSLIQPHFSIKDKCDASLLTEKTLSSLSMETFDQSSMKTNEGIKVVGAKTFNSVVHTQQHYALWSRVTTYAEDDAQVKVLIHRDALQTRVQIVCVCVCVSVCVLSTSLQLFHIRWPALSHPIVCVLPTLA